jgi:enoyl-CoA hydratase/carnithine racemase
VPEFVTVDRDADGVAVLRIERPPLNALSRALLGELVGPARAKEMIWSGRQVGAAEALAIGLVDRVTPDDALLAGAIDWAKSFAAGAVVAMGAAKQAIDRGLDRELAAGNDLEADLFADIFATEDARTGVQSFLEHGPGKATFLGR